MASINKVRVEIQTGNDGTDGEVYLGIGGREYHLDTSANDFESNSRRTYILGEDHNVLNPNNNDPRRGRILSSEDLDTFPTYIRFQPTSPSDTWALANAAVFLNDDGIFTYESLIQNEMVMGQRSTLFFHLSRHID